MSDVLDEGPFFHGTKADLQVGDVLTAGFRSNYRPEIVMNHIYFTALPDGAGLGIPAGRIEAATAVGRLGIIESIRGRVTALGGTAELLTGPSGTEWEIVVPRSVRGDRHE